MLGIRRFKWEHTNSEDRWTEKFGRVISNVTGMVFNTLKWGTFLGAASLPVALATTVAGVGAGVATAIVGGGALMGAIDTFKGDD